MQCQNRAFWLKAALEEMTTVAKIGTFEFTPTIPPSRKALPSKWVWKTKRSTTGLISQFKARWVIRGDLQWKGIDYSETFAPVANLATL